MFFVFLFFKYKYTHESAANLCSSSLFLLFFCLIKASFTFWSVPPDGFSSRKPVSDKESCKPTSVCEAQAEAASVPTYSVCPRVAAMNMHQSATPCRFFHGTDRKERKLKLRSGQMQRARRKQDRKQHGQLLIKWQLTLKECQLFGNLPCCTLKA